MKKSTKLPSWNVWIWSFSLDKLEVYDVVPILYGAIRSLRKKDLPQTKEDFSEILRSEAMYYFWAKCEWEMIIHAWPERDNDKKVDVYNQLCLNWDTFVDWFWDKIYKPEFIKEKTKETKK